MIMESGKRTCPTKYSLWPLFGAWEKKYNKMAGFTLLELIVVMIVIGVLSAVSLPVFIGQIGKARESEVKLKIGTLARSQTAYHYTQGVFATTMAQIAADSGPVSSFYYTFPDPTTDATGAVWIKHQAIAVAPGKYQTKDYAVGVYTSGGAYNRATCQGSEPGEVVNVGDSSGDDCTNNGVKIQ